MRICVSLIVAVALCTWTGCGDDSHGDPLEPSEPDDESESAKDPERRPPSRTRRRSTPANRGATRKLGPRMSVVPPEPRRWTVALPKTPARRSSWTPVRMQVECRRMVASLPRIPPQVPTPRPAQATRVATAQTREPPQSAPRPAKAVSPQCVAPARSASSRPRRAPAYAQRSARPQANATATAAFRCEVETLAPVFRRVAAP
jgi:hypothetical protein